MTGTQKVFRPTPIPYMAK